MNELAVSITIAFAVVGAVSVACAILVIIYYLLRLFKKRRKVHAMVVKYNEVLKYRERRLTEYFSNKEEMDEGSRDFSIQQILDDEKKIYSRYIRFYITGDSNLLWHCNDEVDMFIDRVMRLMGSEKPKAEAVEKESTALILKKENHNLREENGSLRLRLDTAMSTIDNMLNEYAALYETNEKRANMKQLENAKKAISEDMKRKPG